MSPLSSARFDSSKPGSVERILSYIPIVGWTVSWFLEQFRINPIYYDIREQLLARPDTSSSWTFLGPQRDAAAQICRILADNFGWPNNHFLPEDPLRVIFWERTGTGEEMSAISDLEEVFDVSIPYEPLLALEKAMMLDLVEFILSLPRVHPERRAA